MTEVTPNSLERRW